MWQGRLRLAEALKKVDGAGGNDDEPDHLAMGDTLGFAEHINQMSIGDAISKLELALKAELEVANPQVHRFEPPQPRVTRAQGLVLLNPAHLTAERWPCPDARRRSSHSAIRGQLRVRHTVCNGLCQRGGMPKPIAAIVASSGPFPVPA